jgi:hypothetical protein
MCRAWTVQRLINNKLHIFRTAHRVNIHVSNKKVQYHKVTSVHAEYSIFQAFIWCLVANTLWMEPTEKVEYSITETNTGSKVCILLVFLTHMINNKFCSICSITNKFHTQTTSTVPQYGTAIPISCIQAKQSEHIWRQQSDNHKSAQGTCATAH